MNRLPGLSRLLSNSDPPQPAEAALIENVVQLMDETIEGLEAQLAKVKGERQQYRALLSPLRRMPVEVLGEIFSYAVEAAVTVRMGMKQAAVLCMVCRTWRNAAYATHRIWSSFEIRLEDGMGEWDRVDMWIALSGAVPKKISVYSGDDVCDRDDARGRTPQGCSLSGSRLVTLLTSSSVSIDTLTISCCGSVCMRGLCAAIESAEAGPARPWDRTKSLKVQVRTHWSEEPFADDLETLQDDDDAYDPEDFDTFFKSLPPVTSFHLDTPPNFRSSHTPYIPIPPSFLSHLTTLSLDNDWNGEAVVRILQSCHQGALEELILGCKSEYVEHLSTCTGFDDWVEDICDNPDKMFVLPRLRSLRFRELHPYSFKIVYFFKAPSLAELEVGFADVEDTGAPSSSSDTNVFTVDCEDISADLPAFIETSGCQATLKRLLFFGGVKLQMEDLKIWLSKKLLPSLSHLTFNGVYLPLEFMECLCDIRSWNLSLDHVKTIELLNLPTECHFLGRYLAELRRKPLPEDQAHLTDTNVVVTIMERQQ